MTSTRCGPHREWLSCLDRRTFGPLLYSSPDQFPSNTAMAKVVPTTSKRSMHVLDLWLQGGGPNLD